MKDYKQEFFEFEEVSKIYADSFLYNYFNIKKDTKLANNIHREMINLYVMYEYLDYKQKNGLKIKEKEFCDLLESIGRSNYAKTLVDYCKLCGKFTRERYDEGSLVKYIIDYNKKKFNFSICNMKNCSYEPIYIMGDMNV